MEYIVLVKTSVVTSRRQFKNKFVKVLSVVLVPRIFISLHNILTLPSSVLEIMEVEDPSKFQPSNSNTDPTDVEACRICLATDVKMYSLAHLGHSMDTITGCSKSFNGLLNVVCYQCAPILIKYNKLIEKSRKAQTILEHILETNGQITKPLIEEQNKSQLDLKSPLDSYLLKNYYYINYDDNNTSNLITAGNKINIKLKNEIKEECSAETSVPADKEIENAESKLKIVMNSDSDSDVESIEVDDIVVQISSDDDEFISLKSHEVNLGKKSKDLLSAKYANREKRCLKGITKKGKKKKYKGKRNIRTLCNPPDDTFINKFFDVKKIPVPKTPNMKFTCKLCQKVFSNKDDAKDHRFLGCERKRKNTTRVFSPPTGQPLFWEDLGGSN